MKLTKESQDKCERAGQGAGLKPDLEEEGQKGGSLDPGYLFSDSWSGSEVGQLPQHPVLGDLGTETDCYIPAHLARLELTLKCLKALASAIPGAYSTCCWSPTLRCLRACYRG